MVLGDHQRSVYNELMTDQLHIRCNECQHWLAGPLTRTSSPLGDIPFDAVIVGFNEFLPVGDIQFSTHQLFEFSFDSQHDLLEKSLRGGQAREIASRGSG